MPKDFTGVYDVLDAIKDAIQSADPAKREALAQTLEAYHHDFPEEFHWALGVEAPMLLYHLLMTIDGACHPEDQPKPRAALRLVRKPKEGDE
jgi:hypothetical protein